MMTLLILTRAVHFGSCLLFFGVFAFDRFMAPASAFVPQGGTTADECAGAIRIRKSSEIANYWQAQVRLFTLVLLPTIFVSGVAWFVLIAMEMSGGPLQGDTLKLVWTQTEFGTVWKMRLVFLLISGCSAPLLFFLKQPGRDFAAWFQLAVNGCLLVSLAWGGHGLEGSRGHLFADCIHLGAAGFWPAGLLPLFLLLRKARRTAANWPAMAVLVRRFSAVSLAAVSALAASGLVNAWVMVGSFPNLLEQVYGRWLLAKIVLFCAAICIGAVNLLRLKPRLLMESSQPENAAATAGQLRTNVRFELFLGTAVIGVVAVLGILPPAAH